MAGCHVHGRLWTEIHNLPLYFLWMIVEHSPAGDHWMRGESFRLIKERIVKLSGRDIKEVEEKVHRLRKIKLNQELLEGGIDPSKQDPVPRWFGGTFTCQLLEEEIFSSW